MIKTAKIGATKQKILDTAEKLFSEKGYDSVSAEDIAKAADITKSVIFYHFEKKQDILYTLMQLKRDTAIRRFTEYVNEKGEVASKDDLFKRCISFVHENKDIFRIALFEFLKTSTGANIILELPNEAIDKFSSFFEFTKEDRIRLIITIVRTIMFFSLCDKLCEGFDISETELEKMFYLIE